MDAAVIVCSDRSFNGTYEDKSGPAAQSWLESKDYRCPPVKVIPDDAEALATSVEQCVQDPMELIVVSGGTGLGPRDITPQTLDRVCDYAIPGFGELLRAGSLKYSLNAYLSRCGAWKKGETLILALPGNPKAVTEQLDLASDLLPHAIDAIKGKCKHRRKTRDDSHAQL